MSNSTSAVPDLDDELLAIVCSKKLSLASLGDEGPKMLGSPCGLVVDLHFESMTS
jgi:hypothetical protein